MAKTPFNFVTTAATSPSSSMWRQSLATLRELVAT